MIESLQWLNEERDRLLSLALDAANNRTVRIERGEPRDGLTI